VAVGPYVTNIRQAGGKKRNDMEICRKSLMEVISLALPKKVLVILNPVAGHGKAKRRLPAVRSALAQSGIPYDVVETERRGHAAEISAAAAKNGYDILAAMGGDGTLSEVVNGLLAAREEGTETSVKIAVIPSGTGNDFSVGAGLFETWEEAVQALSNPGVRYMDAFRFSDSSGITRYVVNSVGIGYDAYVVKRVAELGARKIGGLSYMYEALRGLFFFNPGPLSVSFDGEPEAWYDKTWLCAITNSEKFGGGMKVNPGALPDDGRLNVAFLHGVPRQGLLPLVFLVRGGNHVGKKGVVLRSASLVKLSAPDGFPCHVDGDTVPVRFPVMIQVLPRVLPFVAKARTQE
jgi:diacylglycerol kinase (ATP)